MKFFSELQPKPKRFATISYDEAANREMADQVIKMCGELGMEHAIDLELPASVPDLRPTVLQLTPPGALDAPYPTAPALPLATSQPPPAGPPSPRPFTHRCSPP